ncbi:MAG TPA: hypothetical protein VFJ95_09055 [Gammaproteobacteria bacterium]|nr:hypothetical protein [Gammaproteobacteria bacterium]
MKTLALLLTGALALVSLPASARVHSHVSVGLGFGLPYYYYRPYDPWLYPYAFPPYTVRVPANDKFADPPERLFVYPQGGQTDEQTSRDRDECHDWAAKQSDFDPLTAKRHKADDLADYNRAFTACMEGRNYSVE